MLVSHGYVIKEFRSIDEVSEYIEKQLTQHNLSYAKVYDHTENKMRVVVYQFHPFTLKCSSYTTTTN